MHWLNKDNPNHLVYKGLKSANSSRAPTHCSGVNYIFKPITAKLALQIPRKQPEKFGKKYAVFSGSLRNMFRDPRKSLEKSPEKFSGPKVFGYFEKCTPGLKGLRITLG